MKVGDLIKIKDLLGYNSYMQQIAGWEGILLDICDTGQRCRVFINGKEWMVWQEDVEVIYEGR